MSLAGFRIAGRAVLKAFLEIDWSSLFVKARHWTSSPWAQALWVVVHL